MKYGQTDLNQRWNDIFCRRPSKAGFTIQVYLVCPFHCPLYNTVLAHDNVQEVFCTFSFAHVSMQLIFAVNFHIFERIAYLLVNVSADKVLCIRRLSSHCQSNLSHVRIHSVVSCVSLCLLPRWSEQSLVQSHVDKKKSVRPFLWTPLFTKDNFMKTMEDVVIM